jgi:hypothetical protein
MKWIEIESPMWSGKEKMSLAKVLHHLGPDQVAIWRVRNLDATGAGLGEKSMAELTEEIKKKGNLELSPAELGELAAGLWDLNDIEATGLAEDGGTVIVIRGEDSTFWIVAVSAGRESEIRGLLSALNARK